METYQKLAAQMEEQINQWQKQVSQMQSMLPSSNSEMQKQMETQLKSMQEGMADATTKLTELHEANQAAARDVTDGSTKAFELWQEGWKAAMSRYKP